MTIDINTYQKETQLKDGTKVLLRPMVAEDQDALYEFFQAIPREEARYLRDDVKSTLLVEKLYFLKGKNKRFTE